MKRAIRRHHRERLVRNRRKNISWMNEYTWSGVVANTPTPCSCWMCGNPRKYFKEITRQEKISIIKMKYDFSTII